MSNGFEIVTVTATGQELDVTVTAQAQPDVIVQGDQVLVDLNQTITQVDVVQTEVQVDVVEGAVLVDGPAITSTDQLAEGNNNLYFTDQRAVDAVEAEPELDLNLVSVSGLQLDTANPADPATGRIIWNDGDQVPQFQSNGTTVDIGLELLARCRNVTGSTIPKGTAVCIVGAAANRISIAPSDRTQPGSACRTLGLTLEDIPTDSFGKVSTFGLVRGLDTSAFNEGDELFVGPTPGTLTSTPPDAPARLLTVGYVVTSNANQGQIFVTIRRSAKMEEISDAQITDVSNDDILRYVAANNRWENTAISTDTLTEGNVNVYFTEQRARDSVSASGDLDYDSANGVFSVTTYKSTDFDTDFSGKSTSDLSEGTNLYFTTARVRGNISATGNIIYDSNTGVISQSLTTTDITEGNNLYFTTARARDSFSAGTGVQIVNGNISIGQDVGINANVSFNRITDLSAPVDVFDAANKQYVDNTAQGLKTRTSARVLVDSNLAATYDNGPEDDGIDATLTADVNGAFPTTDGVLSAELNQIGERILVIGQNTAAHNGLYVVEQVGDANNPWQLRRCKECSTDAQIPGSFVFVREGTQYTGTGWVAITDTPFTVGTSDINWTQFSGAGTFLAGEGLELDGNTFKVLTSGGITIESDQVALASTVAGDGMSLANGVLTVGAGDGITVNSANVQVDNTVLRTSGNQTVSGPMNFAQIQATSVDVGTVLETTATTLTTTAQTQIAAFSATTFGSAKIVIQATQGSERHITELLVVHNGATASATEYGTITTNGDLFEIDVDINSGNVRILATGTSATSTSYKVFTTLIKA